MPLNIKRRQKLIGPPSENTFLNSLVTNQNYLSSNSQNLKNERVSILKSLLDDSPENNNNTLFKNDSVVYSTINYNNKLDRFLRICNEMKNEAVIDLSTEPEHRKRTKRRKIGFNKSIIDKNNINIKKYDYKFSLNDYVNNNLLKKKKFTL